jgi:hypothetical protein
VGLKFRAGALEFNANVTEANESASPQTGDPLRTLTIQFRAQKESIHEQAVEQAGLRESGGLYSLDDADQPVLEWRVRDSTFSYVGSAPWGVNHHVWRIEQVERLACDRLVVGSVELEPYDYVEEALEGGVVRLAARALITDSDLRTLSLLVAPVEVTRVGISDTPRAMRVNYVWGERPEGYAVVVACEDVAEPRITVGGLSRLDPTAELLNLLRESGILTDALLEQRHAARHVSAVDGWQLMT